ncbi:MAG: hypothetical protein Q8920_04860 [Bacillota bacterium]|nr:hypothetical protein [Bacillota bacterium]
MKNSLKTVFTFVSKYYVRIMAVAGTLIIAVCILLVITGKSDDVQANNISVSDVAYKDNTAASDSNIKNETSDAKPVSEFQILLDDKKLMENGLEISELKSPVKINRSKAIEIATSERNVGSHTSRQAEKITAVPVLLTNKEHPYIPGSKVVLNKCPVWIVTERNVWVQTGGGAKLSGNLFSSIQRKVLADVNVILDANTGEVLETVSYSVPEDKQKDFGEVDAIAAVLSDHSDFPGTIGQKVVSVDTGGPKGATCPVTMETKAEKVDDETFTVTFIKTWGIKIGNTVPVSYWKYHVGRISAELVECQDNDKMIQIIK